MNTPLDIVAGRSGWHGPDMTRSQDWIYRLDSAEIAEIDDALRHLKATGRQIPSIGKDDFPLPRFGRTLRLLRTELESGSGVVLVRGLPRDRYSPEEMGLIFWAIGSYFGRGRAQNAQGEVLGHVRDMGRDYRTDMHARGYQTAALLPFHTDSCDIVGLCCVEVARSGGLSVLASSVAIYNELVRTRPDLVRVLSEPFCVDRRGEESSGQKPYYVTPVFMWHQGRLYCRYNRTYVDSAQRHSEAPRLTPLQVEALDEIDRLCRDQRFQLPMSLERGDMQFINNFTTFHSRTEYEDFSDPARKRHLLRLWLASTAFEEYPRALLDRYEDMDRWRASPRPPSYKFVDMAEVTTH